MPVDPSARIAPAYFCQGFPLARRAYAGLEAADLPRMGGLRGQEEVRAARLWAERINAKRKDARADQPPAKAGELMAMALLGEILRFVADSYAVQYNPGVLARGRAHAAQSIGVPLAIEAEDTFATLFPPKETLDEPDRLPEYLRGYGQELSNRDLIVRESVLLTIQNGNPAVRGYRSLFDDLELIHKPSYRQYAPAIESFLRKEPPHPETGMNLIETLWAPILANPDDIEAQLGYVRKQWGRWLPEALLETLLLAGGLLREERTMRGHGPGPVEAITFGGAGGGYPEPEAFSVDKDWMPNVVLMAKSTYVWLDQLSKRYARPIDRLDQIPDEELDQLANWGITSLWLIGLWERSSTSKTIKRMMGNPEAEASAYSLFDYTIAWDLGGDTAYKNLADRAWKRGIRLASDMVPNHVGMFSRWTIEHPDWFIQSSHPPFPSYTFNGPDLSPDGRISLNIEDGYWNKTDAAVVFRHHDHRSGQTRYIYHGNDGTSMPWNDTAQLNYLLPEVREAVVQTILHVARMFPVIRFDAAMTLAKKHYQRLWFPKLGDAGAIPSRAEHGMSQEEFDRVFPVEFWREVVDRVATEAPDTLLLAEAFWLMEGYFVRTLGMHRVYNSAFMNMLKMEDNEKFRLTVKNVLEYSPAILQRFVNFMNNPDEDTAEAQFGKGDKYFGVAMLLVTMPGLPMLGHGQVEGLTEKYGMEYRRAYRDEPIDMELVRRHEREIFPLVRRRHLFSGAEHFAFFDFVVPEGWANENVFAYTNRTLHERSLIIYNNAYAPASGTLRVSTAINEASAEEPRLRQRTLVEALGLDTASNCYYIYRDYRLGLDYIEHSQRLDEHGLSAHLHGYQYLALLDWRAVYDHDLSWAKLHGLLAGRGVPSIDDAYMEMVLAPILEPFRELVTAEHLTALYEAEESETLEAAFALFVQRCAEHCGLTADIALLRDEVEAGMEVVRAYAERMSTLDSPALRARLLTCDPELNPRVMTAYALLRPLGRIVHSADTDPAAVSATSGAWMGEWYLARQLSRSFAESGGDAWLAAMDARMVRAMIRGTAPLLALADNAWGPYLDQVFGDAETRVLLRVNNYGGRRWLHKESLANLLSAMLAAVYVEAATYELTATAEESLMLALEDLDTMELAAEDVGFDFDWWLDALK